MKPAGTKVSRMASQRFQSDNWVCSASRASARLTAWKRSRVPGLRWASRGRSALMTVAILG